MVDSEMVQALPAATGSSGNAMMLKPARRLTASQASAEPWIE
jgi:hypothetical protein